MTRGKSLDDATAVNAQNVPTPMQRSKPEKVSETITITIHSRMIVVRNVITILKIYASTEAMYFLYLTICGN